MKSLKFSAGLPELILAGKKTSTWRINDEKDIVVGDQLCLCDQVGKEFAQAQVAEVILKKIGDLDGEERCGHEEYSSDQEMYETFSRYYHLPIGPETEVKVIKFVLLPIDKIH